METSAIRAQIALSLLPHIGAVNAKGVIEYFGSAQDALAAVKADWQGISGISKTWINEIFDAKEAALKKADNELIFIEKHGLRVLGWGEDDYPKALAECVDAPLLLFTKGNIAPNKGHFLSVVGTRRATDRGKQLCHDIITNLLQQVPDLTIVSGLAYGIDIAAHRAALELHRPTWVIPAHGLDRIYPSQHRNEAIASLENGGILTEYLSGTIPEPQNFLARNRIVAGLSEATLVVESHYKGGSLSTAAAALSYGRDVLAIPGRPTDATSAGCNMLIKTNRAALVESAEDIIATLGWQAKKKELPKQLDIFAALSPEADQLLKVIRGNEDGVHVNELTLSSGLPYAQASAALFELELAGAIKSLPGSMYRAIK